MFLFIFQGWKLNTGFPKASFLNPELYDPSQRSEIRCQDIFYSFSPNCQSFCSPEISKYRIILSSTHHLLASRTNSSPCSNINKECNLGMWCQVPTSLLLSFKLPSIHTPVFNQAIDRAIKTLSDRLKDIPYGWRSGNTCFLVQHLCLMFALCKRMYQSQIFLHLLIISRAPVFRCPTWGN